MGSQQAECGESDLVGRDAELLLLDRRMTEVAEGHGGLVLLAGEPGIGKSRLAEEVSQRAFGRGFCVVWGRCREGEGAPPFWPWTQILRGVLRASGLVAPAEIRPLLEARPRTSEVGDRFQLFDTATSLFLDEARRRLLLLVLDDLHRADRSSLGLLRFLAPSVRDARLLLLGTYRSTEVSPSHPLFTLVGEGAGGAGVDLLALSRLTLQDTARLVALHAMPEAPLRAEDLHRRSGGNPFFLTEILRLRPEAAEVVPPTVSAAISARVERLPKPTRRVLALAAVLGREFLPHLVATLDGARADEIDARLAPAVADGLVLPSSGTVGGYRFTHVLVREALYDAIPGRRRTALHDLVVRTLEGLAGSGLVDASDVASHACQAVRTPDERRRAVRLAVRAARLARDRTADEEAVEWFTRALEFGVDTDEERFELLVELGRAAGRAFRVETGRSAFMQAWDLAADRGWPAKLAEAALGLGDVIVSAGSIDAGLVWMLEQTLERAEQLDRRTLVRMTARLAVEIYWGPRLPEARHRAAEAVRAARLLGDPRTLAVSLAAEQFVLRGPDRLAERIGLGEELVTAARALGDAQLELHARRLLLADRLQVEPAGAAAEFDELVALAQRSRRPLAHWYVMVNQCLRAIMAGSGDDILGLIAETEAFGHRIGAQPTRVYAALQRFAARHL